MGGETLLPHTCQGRILIEACRECLIHPRRSDQPVGRNSGGYLLVGLNHDWGQHANSLSHPSLENLSESGTEMSLRVLPVATGSVP